MMGSRVRPRTPVDGFAQGVAEGSKGLAYGFVDGISGIFTEPVDGYRRGVSPTAHVDEADGRE